jgi:type II secretory pathway pseudopilin PulG
MKPFNLRYSRFAGARAFTIIEIAICLGIIGFALVAIIAVLPRGLDVQKRNREETIIDQDADMWMSAIRNGSRGYDDLTNYVIAITNIWTQYDARYNVVKSGTDFYTPSGSGVTSIVPPPTFPLTNGARIIGLLSMPKRMPEFVEVPPATGFQSNYVIAYVRAFSGTVVNKAPQTNSIILSDAFIYRMIVENFPYAPVDTNAFCLNCPAANGLTPAQMSDRTNLSRTVWMLQTNSHDFRLRFRWPVLPNGQIPNYGLATFRAMTSGGLLQIYDTNAAPSQPMYFVQSSSYAEVTNLP